MDSSCSIFCSSKFLIFAGFNGLHFLIRWIQLVVVFFGSIFCSFCCYFVCASECFCI